MKQCYVKASNKDCKYGTVGTTMWLHLLSRTSVIVYSPLWSLSVFTNSGELDMYHIVCTCTLAAKQFTLNYNSKQQFFWGAKWSTSAWPKCRILIGFVYAVVYIYLHNTGHVHLFIKRTPLLSRYREDKSAVYCHGTVNIDQQSIVTPPWI